MDLRGEYEAVKKGARLRLDWLITAYRSYTGQEPFFISYFEKLAGTDRLRKDIIAGKTEEEIKKRFNICIAKIIQRESLAYSEIGQITQIDNTVKR